MELKHFIETHFFKLAFRDRPKAFESTGESLRRWGRLYIVWFYNFQWKSLACLTQTRDLNFYPQLSNATVSPQGLCIYCTQRDFCGSPGNDNHLRKLERCCKESSSQAGFCEASWTPGGLLYRHRGYISISGDSCMMQVTVFLPGMPLCLAQLLVMAVECKMQFKCLQW